MTSGLPGFDVLGALKSHEVRRFRGARWPPVRQAKHFPHSDSMSLQDRAAVCPARMDRRPQARLSLVNEVTSAGRNIV